MDALLHGLTQLPIYSQLRYFPIDANFKKIKYVYMSHLPLLCEILQAKSKNFNRILTTGSFVCKFRLRSTRISLVDQQKAAGFESELFFILDGCL